MRRITLFLFLFILSFSTQAQNIEGLWHSSDSTRVYEIREVATNKFSAFIKSSTRKTDTVGYTVIKDLAYNTRKKRYEGFIYAAQDGKPVFAKIRFNKADANKINLKLSRMFVFDVSIDWIRI